jgi:hypothetical protein
MSHKAAVGEGQLHHATQVLRVSADFLRWLRARDRSLATAHRLTSTYGSPRPLRPGPTRSASCAGQVTPIAVRSWPWRAMAALLVRRSTKPAGSRYSVDCSIRRPGATTTELRPCSWRCSRSRSTRSPRSGWPMW